MLKWFRLKKPMERIQQVAERPLQIMDSRNPALTGQLWRSPYCCTLAYFWTAVVTERVCGPAMSDDDKREVLREAFARIVEEFGGSVDTVMNRVLPDGNPTRRRALSDLKRAVDLYRGDFDDRYMIYADYREAVNEDGRPALFGNRWGLDREAAHEILIASSLAGNLQSEEERPRARTAVR